MTTTDLLAARQWIEANDINYVYPDPRAFRNKLDTALSAALQVGGTVSSFPGYRAVLKQFLNSFDDEHRGVKFSVEQSVLYWPGFTVRFSGGEFIVALSQRAGVHDGQTVQGCDGSGMNGLIERAAAIEGGHVGLDSTKANLAPLLLIDAGDPLLTRPAVCVIGGLRKELEWERLPFPQYTRTIMPLLGSRTRQLRVSALMGNAAWVRIGTFNPTTAVEVSSFRRLLRRLPSLRNKRAIILDVRENGGGPYDWMVATLRSLYGDVYTDYYARSRLSIRPVYRASPAILHDYKAGDAQDSTADVPKDAATHVNATLGVQDALAARRAVFIPKMTEVPQAQFAPPDPVNARVYVLTDYSCASVCIGLVDELKRFPGVLQIGTETFVDSRSGTPLVSPLPSGLAAVYVPTMTRDGRLRDDNVPQRPQFTFAGDIEDEQAVRRWVLDWVLAQPANRRSAVSPKAKREGAHAEPAPTGSVTEIR